MPALFIYLIKVNIALLIFCLGYYAVLRHLTFYTLNRVYLVTAIVFSALYPFINLSAFINRHQEIAQPIQVVVVNWQYPAHVLVQSVSRHDQWYWLQIIFWAGVLVFSLRLVTQLLSLYRLHKQSEPMQIRHYMIRVIKGDINPFSFWRSIYINPANHPPHELDAILEHEQIHVNDWHTLDILLGEVSTIFYWFNPGIWLMKKAIRENIEFITDRKILQKGIDCKVYQYSLINVNFGAQSNAIVNHFNISTIKKRIMMMNAKKSSALNLTRYMLLVPAVVIMLLIFSVSKAELNKAANNSVHLFNKALKTVVNKLSIDAKKQGDKNPEILKAVSGIDIPAVSLNIQPQLADFTFTPPGTNKLNIGEAFTGASVYIDAEKSTCEALTQLDASQIAKMVLYTDIPKNDHDGDVKHYLFVVTRKNAGSDQVNTFLNEFQKNDSTAIAHNYTITPASATSSSLNMSSIVYPKSVMNSIYSKAGISKRATQPDMLKAYDTVLVMNTDKMPKIGADEARLIFSQSANTTKSGSFNPKIIGAWNIKTQTNSDTLISTYTDENGIAHKPIVSTFRYLTKPDSVNGLAKKPDPDPSNRTTVTFNGHTYTRPKTDTSTYTDKNGVTRLLVTKVDVDKSNNVTKIRVNDVAMSKDSLLTAMQGWKVEKDGAVTKSGKPPLFGNTLKLAASPASINFKDQLIIIDGKEATQKQLKKLSADRILSINIMKRDTAILKYGDKAKNGAIAIITKQGN